VTGWALEVRLPESIAAAVVEFMIGPLLEAPTVGGKALQRELAGYLVEATWRVWRRVSLDEPSRKSHPYWTEEAAGRRGVDGFRRRAPRAAATPHEQPRLRLGPLRRRARPPAVGCGAASGNTVRMRILVAEDDAATRMLLVAMLTGLGHQCTEASDGEQAWRSFLDVAPDVVITDRNMPVVDGLELCRRIRSEPQGQRVSILLVTAHGTAPEVLEGIAAGADDYLLKPVEPFILRVRLLAAERVAGLHRQLEDAAMELVRRNAELSVTARTDVAAERVRRRVAAINHGPGAQGPAS